MPHAFTLLTIPHLLQATPSTPPVMVPSWLAYIGLFSLIVSLISVGFAIFSAFRKESREDKQARESAQNSRFKKLEDAIGQFVDKDALEGRFNRLETAKDNHETRLTGYQMALEKVVETMERRVASMENQMGDVRQVREDMAGMKAKMEFLTESQRQINDKLDRLLERR